MHHLKSLGLLAAALLAVAPISQASKLPQETLARPSVEQLEQQLLAGWKNLVFRIEDSKCRVGIAAVLLSVSELTQSGENLVGEYRITVPLMTSRNDRGRIILPLNLSVDELGESGGRLIGQAISNDPEKPPSRIICEIIPANDQAIRLAITTPDRTLNFKSRYTIRSTAAGS